MGAILYHALTTFGDGVPEFGIRARGDSGYGCYYDVLISYTKKADGGYNFDETDYHNHIDRYRVFYLTSNVDEDKGGEKYEP